MTEQQQEAIAARTRELLTGEPRQGATSTPILFMSETDLADVHDKIANAMRAIGFTGPALDEAIAGAFKTCIDLIERNRAVDAQRRARLRVV